METKLLDIPDCVLVSITDKFEDIKDYVRCGAVCQSWRSINNEYPRQYCPHRRLPLLMLPTEHDQENQTRSLYNLSESKVSDLLIQLPHNQLCRGSSEGWLIILSDNESDIRLLNPFLSYNNEIQLPPLTAFRRKEEPFKLEVRSEADLHHVEDEVFNGGFLVKAVLSANPATNPNYVVMAIYGEDNKLAFFKPGDQTWTSLDFMHKSIQDVVYYKDQFYAVNYLGEVFSCDVNHPHPKLMEVAPAPDDDNVGNKNYLVDSFGDLLQVRKLHGKVDEEVGDDLNDGDVVIADEDVVAVDGDVNDGDVVIADEDEVAVDDAVTIDSEDDSSYGPLNYSDITSGFEVLKLDPILCKWNQVKSLHGQTLFLGDSASMSISSSDFPGCISNCIFFTDDRYKPLYRRCKNDEPHDMGIFNLEDGKCHSMGEFSQKASWMVAIFYRLQQLVSRPFGWVKYVLGRYRSNEPIVMKRKMIFPPIWIEPTPSGSSLLFN